MSDGQKMNVAIVFASIDGVLGTHAGIGTVTSHFINQFPEIAKRYDSKQIKLSLHILTPKVALKYPGYSRTIHRKTESTCRNFNGELHLIDASSSGKVSKNQNAEWDEISRKTAMIVLRLSSKFDQVIVYLVGLPFLKSPQHINQSNTCHQNVKLILLSYSDFFIFNNLSHKSYIDWEDRSFQQINYYDNTYIAATSTYQINILKKRYKWESNKIIPLQTGLYMNADFFKPISRSRINETLQKYNIPTDTDIIFSVARATPQKGLSELLLTFAQLIKIRKKPVHLVFVTSNFMPFPSASIVSQLKQLVSTYQLEEFCTPIYEHDFELPRHMLQWENTKIVAQLALQESFGLVPEEARISPNKLGPVVVASNVGGHKEQITNGKDGFLVDPHNHLQTARTMSNILNKSEPELAKIRKAGLARAKRDYDYSKNVIESLDLLLR